MMSHSASDGAAFAGKAVHITLQASTLLASYTVLLAGFFESRAKPRRSKVTAMHTMSALPGTEMVCQMER